MASGIIGVPLGSYLSQKLMSKYSRSDPIICAVGLIISAPLLAAAMLLVTNSTWAVYTLIFFGELALNLNWAIVADILLVRIQTVKPMRFMYIFNFLFGFGNNFYFYFLYIQQNLQSFPLYYFALLSLLYINPTSFFPLFIYSIYAICKFYFSTHTFLTSCDSSHSLKISKHFSVFTYVLTG